MTYAGLFGDTCISALCCVVQVQMRFCVLDTSCEQDDCFPPGICVQVHGKLCPLPVSNIYGCYKGQDFFFNIYIYSGESNGKLPLRTCPGCSVPEPYQSPD